MGRKNHGFGKWFHAAERNRNYDEEYDTFEDDDIEYGDEYYEEDGEYYADGEGYSEDGEYYADGEGYSEDGEYYAEEEGYSEDGEYYAEEEDYNGDGEYYADGEDREADGGYYAEEEDYNGDGEYYAEEEEGSIAGGYFAEEEKADYAYLAEDEGVEPEVSMETMEFIPVGDTEYYSDEAYDGEEYYEEEIYEDEDGESYYSEEYESDDEAYYGDEELSAGWNRAGSGRNRKKGHRRQEENAFLAFFENLRQYIVSMTAMDRLVAATGAIVMVIVMVTCSVYASAKAVDAQVAAFYEVGDKLDTLGVGGESGLVAMADASASAAEIDALFEEETEMETEEEAEEKEEAIGFNMTSVEKDLKIKFVNSSTNRLISGIAFEVEVVGPDNKTTTWTDDDKDGVIYKKDLTPGNYKVTLKEIDAIKDYKYYTGTQSVKVKDKIEYVKIDVIDEVKTEAEVNAAVEDTAIQEPETAPALKDTVEWVESTKTPISGSGSATEGEYEELKKDKITDPLTVSAAAGSFLRLSQTNGENGNTTESESGDTKPSESASTNPSESESTKPSESESTKPSESESTNPSESGSTNPSESESTKPSESESQPVVPQDPYKIDSVKLNHSTLTLTSGGTTFQLEAIVTLSGSTGTAPSKAVTWKSSNENVVKVSGGTLTSVGAGTATVTATSEADSGKSASCAVTVTESELKLTMNPATLALKINESSKLSVSISADYEIAKTEWVTNNDKIATVANDGTVKAVAAGEAAITAKVTTKTNKTVEATCKVTVSNTDVKLTLSKSELTVFTELTGELKATIENTVNGDVIEWVSDNTKLATVKASDDKKTGTITGVAAGTANVSVVVKRDNKEIAKATCKVTVRLNPKKDTTTKLKDNDGNQVYIKNKDGKFVEATLADYYTASKFYILAKNVEYKYTGWQTIDGKTYYYTKDGKRVTGEQVIQGMKYNFDSDGALMKGSGNMGIDVSKWNGSIDWNAVKNSGVSYVIIRCGYRGSSSGAMIVDPKFKTNIQGATAAGLKVGIYFFSQAVNEVEAVEEASMTLSLIKGHKISYPVFIDIEGSGGRGDRIDKNTRTAVANAFCKTIQNGGYTAGIYANKSWFETKMNTSSLTGYKLWLAQYAAQPTYKATRYDMWQYTSKGKINGISGNVDLNVSYLGY